MTSNISPFDTFLSRITPIGDVLLISKAVDNWYELALFRLGFSRSVTLRLRSGRKRAIRNERDYYDFMNGTMDWALELAARDGSVQIGKDLIELEFQGRKVVLYYDSPESLGNSVHLATQEFIDEEYSQLDVKKRDVVDIGGSIGDSAIYFALRGARRVYSFEPFPHTFELARRNIRLNGLGAKVKLLNKAVSGAGGSIHIRKDFGVRIDSNLSDGMSARGKRIGIVSLDSIVSRYKVKNAVLKIDCEGSEYGIIQKASRKALGAFSQIMIEYHYGYMDLERKLGDAGFRVTHTIPKYAAYYNTMRPAMYIGKVLATREW